MARECFCPYLDGPEKCGMADFSYKFSFIVCNAPYSGEGRMDCPIIRERGDIYTSLR